MKRIFVILALAATTVCHGQANAGKIADAIKVAEGQNPHWWYGVHHPGKEHLSEPVARAKCLAVISREYARFQHQSTNADFIDFLAPTYCGGDWRRWESNVKLIMKLQASGK